LSRWSGGSDPLARIARRLRRPTVEAPRKPARSLSHLRKRIAASETPEAALAEIVAFAGTRCGARTRLGRACLRRAFPNGRCRNHGGLSTGPRTLEGRLRALANLKQFQAEKSAPGSEEPA
jgi:hypothetical protein